MMTHRSIKSSEIHVRTKPALRLCQRSFQKVVCDFLKSKEIPQIIEHGLRSNARGVLVNRPFYAWRRLSHLRSSFLYMESGKPVALIPPHADESTKAWTIRIPINHRELETVGPVVCECYWDNVDHELTISDVIYYNKENVWQTKSFSDRYEIMSHITQQITQNTDDYSDCTIGLPAYESLAVAASWDDIDSDNAFCVAFQPEDAGARRFRYVVARGGGGDVSKKHRSQEKPPRKPTAMEIQSESESDVEPAEKEFTYINPLLPAPTPIVQKNVPARPSIMAVKGDETAILTLDTKNPLPDVYKLRAEKGGKDMGIAAVRSLDLSLELRAKIKMNPSLRVSVAWYEPFKKWEVTGVC